jgi:hypothetical protein
MTKPTGRPRGRPKTLWYSTLMARVPDDLAERVKRYAGMKQQTISDVIRDALELLLEGERFQPFTSNRNTARVIASDMKEDGEILSDIKVDRLHMMSDAKEAADMLSDEKAEEDILSDVKEGDNIMSDMKQEHTDNPSDTKAADVETVPSIASDTKADMSDITPDVKAVHVGSMPEPAMLSDTNQTFDAIKYRLGKLCPRGHEWGTTGKSLRVNNKAGYCLRCNAALKREKRQPSHA